MTNYEFASAEFVDMMREVLSDALANEDLAGIDFTMSEEFTDPPEHLKRDGADTIGFHFRIRDGRVEIGDGPCAEADVLVVADYAAILPGARRTHGPNPGDDPETMSMVRELTESGRYSMTSRRPMPSVLARIGLHDLLAVRIA